MKNSLISFINDNNNIMDELELTEQDLLVAIKYSDMLLAEIDYLAASIDDKELSTEIYSNNINSKIIDKIQQLNIPLKHKFILLAMNISIAPQTEEWFVEALNIKEKITWKEYWIKFLEMGESVIDQFVADMFKEIYIIQVCTDDETETEAKT